AAREGRRDARGQGEAAGRGARRDSAHRRRAERRAAGRRSAVLHQLRDAKSPPDLLSQDEIEPLLHGVDSGKVKTDAAPAPGEARSYDFATQDRLVRGRMPTLEMINERFARHYRISLFNMLRRAAELSVKGVEMMKFSDYLHS